MTIDEAMGQVMRNAQKTLDKNQTEFGAALGWTQRKVSRVQSGKQPARLPDVEQVAGLLKKHALDLVEEAYVLRDGSVSR